MIFGNIGTASLGAEREIPWSDWGVADETQIRHKLLAENGFVALTSSGAPSHDAGHVVYTAPEDDVTVALYGNIFNLHELQEALGLETNGAGKPVGPVLVEGYRRWGTDLYARLNGNFILAIHDPRENRFWIARDHLGIESLFYCRKGDQLFFSSRLAPLARHPEVNADLNPTAVLRYLIFNYNPAFDTFFQGVEKLRPGYVLRLENERMMITPYWYISFKEPFDKDLETYRRELLELLKSAVHLRLDAERFRTGAYLSGGMDSSTVVALMRPKVKGPLHTFSFRCRGKSYDESAYARLMSERYETVHHEVPYEAADVHRIEQLAAASEEPFSDIGIEVASFLLAEKAAGEVDYVLTGDGGDELFAGHPVYLADKMAERFEKVPGFVRAPLTRLLQKLPDTEQKKSLPVKAKRFSYSVQFPAELHSNRWRAYYLPAELRRLLHDDWKGFVDSTRPLDDIVHLYDEADGPDALSRTLYGDYYTVVGFYLRRMEMVRRFGLEGRFPLLDHRLVEYTARIPSHWKIGPSGATKYIFHKVMAGVLPDEIVFRKDKLGHSVPFKNWLRQSPEVQRLVDEVLAPDVLKKRGLVDPEFVQQLKQRHLRRAENNSHRLWALVVLELWCRSHLDGRQVAAETVQTRGEV